MAVFFSRHRVSGELNTMKQEAGKGIEGGREAITAGPWNSSWVKRESEEQWKVLDGCQSLWSPTMVDIGR